MGGDLYRRDRTGGKFVCKAKMVNEEALYKRGATDQMRDLI